MYFSTVGMLAPALGAWRGDAPRPCAVAGRCAAPSSWMRAWRSRWYPVALMLHGMLLYRRRRAGRRPRPGHRCKRHLHARVVLTVLIRYWLGGMPRVPGGLARHPRAHGALRARRGAAAARGPDAPHRDLRVGPVLHAAFRDRDARLQPLHRRGRARGRDARRGKVAAPRRAAALPEEPAAAARDGGAPLPHPARGVRAAHAHPRLRRLLLRAALRQALHLLGQDRLRDRLVGDLRQPPRGPLHARLARPQGGALDARRVHRARHRLRGQQGRARAGTFAR